LIDEVAPNPHDRTQKVALAAQILALVWYRHAAFRDQEVSPATVRAALRRMESRLAAPKVVETYVHLLQSGTQDPVAGASLDPVLIVSEPNEVAQQLSVHLKYGGFRVVEVENIPAARQLVQRVQPKAVLVNHQRYADGAVALCTWVKRSTGAFVYAFSSLDKPSLVMELLDAGFDDVYVPPFNFNVIVTRIGRSLERGGAIRPSGSARGTEQGFRGTLQELPFVDLIQALGASQRSLRIDLVATKGEGATVYLRRGRVAHAVCGPVAGADAIYRIIGWRDEGRFFTAPIVNYPPDNVTEPNDTLLFEGCRLLDEARR
jgi:DNA-binding NarL/FixJ family response regulator